MAEINLLDRLPTVKRDAAARAESKTDDDRAVAKRFDRDFFDGARRHGYGGYTYDGRWLPVARRIAEHYSLPSNARILDVGAAKGFLMYDFLQILPQATVRGLDVSTYAKAHAHEGMDEFIDIGTADHLPYDDNSFDLVLSINSIHNLPLERCKKSLCEIERVSNRASYVTVDAWTTDAERQRLLDWILTAETYMHVNDWIELFNEVGYRGDYWWFIP
jgi:hypothetical protein